MSKKKQEEVVEVEMQDVQGEQGEKAKVVAEFTISTHEDGGISINLPEGGKELSPAEIEIITRNVSEQLRESRIAQAAVEMFKARLG